MKRIVSLLFALLLILPAMAQKVTFSFQAGSIEKGALRTTMETNMSKLLTELNTAGRSKRDLKLDASIMEPEARKNLIAFWRNMRFFIEDKDVIQRCLNDELGYQVREIAITLSPTDNSFSGNLDRELVVSFNKSGRITGVRTAISNNQVLDMQRNALGVTDARRRLEIMKFVEDFRCYYIEKNLSALEKIFADDALIITGSVIKQQTMASLERPEMRVKYRKEDKPQYLKRLETQIFKNNKYINVEFDQISIVRHPADGKQNFYGVTLHQDWSTYRNGSNTAGKPSYQDEGWLFLLWEFHDDGTPPVIHVRSWQPDELILNGGSKIDMNDFTF